MMSRGVVENKIIQIADYCCCISLQNKFVNQLVIRTLSFEDRYWIFRKPNIPDIDIIFFNFQIPHLSNEFQAGRETF